MRDSTPAPGPSPYQPPAIIPEEENRLRVAADAGPPPPLPLLVPAGFAAAAVVISGALALIAFYMRGDSWTGVVLLCSPLMLLTIFVLLCLQSYSSQPLMTGRAWGWQILTILLVPPVSLLIFVPVFVGSTLFVLSLGRSGYLMVVPVGIAYFVTAVAISRWLWWWYADAHGKGPFDAARWRGEKK